MFTVKATYRNETRRFTFPESTFFPTYNELHHQLYRVFPISHNYYLSRLIFSPDASKPGRILIGKEIHSAEDYDLRVAPLRRLWPSPLLRFTIFDETPHKVPGRGSERSSLYSDLAVPPSDTSTSPSPVVSRHNGVYAPNSHALIPPPPPPPQPPATCVVPLPPSPSKMFPPPSIPTSSKSYSSECGTAGTAPCCSITKGRADIQVLLSSFKEDLEHILCRTLGTGNEEEPSAARVEESTSRASDVDIIHPRNETPGSVANASSQWCFVCKTSFTGVWYGCIKCPWHAVVSQFLEYLDRCFTDYQCPSCFSKSHSAHTLSFGPSHIVQQRSIDCSTQVSAQIVRESTARNSIYQSPASTPSGPAGEPALPVHHGVVCDSCSKTIVGIRHKCLDCPVLDYDLCAGCMESGATEQHNPFHEFFDIETPGRVYVHTVFGGNRDRPFGGRQQPSSSDHNPVTRQGSAGTPADLPIRHSASCNLCDSAIVGERFKCVTCPGKVLSVDRNGRVLIYPDFDTCSSCFRITTEQHPTHGFVRVNRPEDLMLPTMRNATVRCLSLLFLHIVEYILNTACGKMIRGARYKVRKYTGHCSLSDPFQCMHPSCPDFDLCSDCEALPIPVHPLNHPMLKLRTSDTVIPTVYRVGRTQMIHGPVPQKAAPVSGEFGSPVLPRVLLPPSPLTTPTKSPEPKPVVPSDQVTNVTVEDQVPSAEEFLSPLGSPASEVPPTSLTIAPSHLLVDVEDPPRSPRSTHPPLDIFYQLWPRVNQEMVHLNETRALSAEGSVINPIEVAITQVAEESLPASTAASSIYEARERYGTCQVSRVPSTKSIVDGYGTPSSTPSNDQKSYCITQQSLAGDQQEIVTANVPCLDSAFVGDANVPDGQIFPPGAEFVKGWHMMNTGVLPWPTTAEVLFVAGEMFASECSAALRAKVGVVHPGQALDIWTGDLKAPDAPGRQSRSLTVADHNSDQASEQSLAASSMVMPSAHPTNSVNASDVQDAPQPSLPSTKTVTDELEDAESDISSVSLVSVPTSDDEDMEWQDTRTHSEPLEYVVLYDNNPEE
ncbi:hypothetical protein JVT61DRAFT_5349 [Boletus reticuloceps]|uniref:ZZ-type domain-containing protein n=1 Tax=Boletus reticuloceps TaxID=495285 RepID=A0A8I2YZF4_9AGAM|nr:hypothetical protein JVT61DRAFT_5349 [Boletus reticuloceps]